MTELVSVSDGEKKGATDPVHALAITLGDKLRCPYDVKGANVRSYKDEGGSFRCSGVVMGRALAIGEHLFLGVFTAPLMGYYNAEPSVLCAAYGRPIFVMGWVVEVVLANGGIAVGNAYYHDTVELKRISDCDPKTPEKP